MTLWPELRSFLRIEHGRRLARLYFTLVLGAGTALLELAAVGLVYPFITVIGDPTALRTRKFLAPVAAHIAPGQERLAIALLAALLVGVYLAKCAVQAVQFRTQVRLVAAWQADLSKRLHALYLRAPYQTHLNRHSAELIRNATVLVRGSYGEFLTALISLAADVTAALGIVVFLLVMVPIPAVLAAATMAVLMGGQHAVLRRRVPLLGAESAELCRREQVLLQQSLGAVKEAQVLGRQGYFESHFAAVEDSLADNAGRFDFIRKLPPVISEASMMIVLLVAVISLVILTRTGSGVLVGLGVLAATSFRLMPQLNRIIASLHAIHHSREGLRLLEVEIDTHPVAAVATDQAEPVSWTTSLAVENLGFRFAGATRAALTDVSFAVAKGEMVGLVGDSGAGKSTLADILLGLLPPSSGRLLVDGRPLPPGARLAVGYVPQAIYLFDDSLKRNIAFGIDDADIDEGRVRQVLAMAQLGDLVAHLPAGLDTALGEHGQRLSGGQRQRIGIARALYHHPDLLILDEATSALDVQTEEEVSRTIATLRGTVTVITIAHRLSTVRDYDRIVFLRDGRIADIGRFDTLVATNPDFATLTRLAGMAAPR